MSNEVATITEAREAASRPTVVVGRAQGDLDSMYRLAQYMAASNAVPPEYKGKTNDVLVVSMLGADLGLSPMQSVLNIDMIKGRPTMRANLWVSLARKAGHKVRVVENGPESTTVTVTRNDDPDGPISATYTIADAKTAELLSNSNYQKNPKAMLYARAATTAVRQACPEVALGFADEYENAAPAPAHPSLAQVAAERTDQVADVIDAEPVAAEPSADELAELAEIAAEHAPAEDLGQLRADDPDLLAGGQ
jgi:hypothetical protein